MHHFESRGFKVGRSSHRKSSTRKVFVKFRKIDRKTLESESAFLSVLRIFWEYLFYWTLPGDCFWKDLIVKKFNSVSLIFVNAQLYHAPPEWSLLFWSKKEHLLMKKHNSILYNELFLWYDFRGVQSCVHNFFKIYRKVLV